MFGLFGTKKNAILDKQKNYVRIQFLTEEQKISKNIALEKLAKQYLDDDETLIPYQESFECSYRFTFNASSQSATNKSTSPYKIQLKQLASKIKVSSNPQLREFVDNNIESIIMYMQNEKVLKNDDIILLLNQVDVSLYDPKEIVEIIYQEKGLWQRIRNKAKKAVQKIPNLLFLVIGRILRMLIGSSGIGVGLPSLLFKFVPMRVVLQWVLNTLIIFFPMLAPLVGMSKFII